MSALSHKEALPILAKVREKVKKSKVVSDLCKEYGVDVDYIDLIPMAFTDLYVSARTERGCIYFNNQLLEDGFENDDHYMTHEVVHHFQQCHGDGPTKGSNNSEDYLDNEFEQEGFQAQIEYLSETRNKDEAEKYVNQVLDHHDVPAKEKEKRKDELLNVAYKKADTFKVPKDPINLLYAWVNKNMAGWIHSAILPNLQLSNESFQSLLKRNLSPEMEELVNLRMQANRINTQPIPLNKSRMITVPLVYFAGEEYFDIDPTDIEQLLDKDWKENVSFTLYPSMLVESDEDVVGMWDPESQSVFVSVNVEGIGNSAEFYEEMALARETLYHETQHLMQNLMSDIINANVGLPPKRILRKYKGDTENDHLSPHEFQPRLTDAVHEFNRLYGDLPYENKREMLERYIDTSDFFKTLKQHDLLRWQKAVNELVKATKTVV